MGRTAAAANATHSLPRAPLMPGAPVLGSVLDLKRDWLGLQVRAFREYGDVVRFVFGPPGLRQDAHGVYHPDGAAHVLAGSSASNFRKDNVFYEEVRGLFGDALLTSQDEDWQRQKRFLQPLFTVQRVEGYAEAMVDEIQRLAQQWRTGSAGMVDLHDEMTRLTLRIVVRVLFGGDATRAIRIVQSTYPVLGEAVKRRGLAPIRLPLTWPTPLNRRAMRAQQQLYGMCDEIIARRRSGATSGHRDLVGLLIDSRDAGESLKDVEVRDQLLLFLLAGHETTATALTFALHLIGRHPQVQQHLLNEARQVLGTRAPTVADAYELSYTSMTLKEAMRLYPSAPLLGRLSVSEDELCGYHLPAGSQVILAPWVIHRRPDLWEQPERFDPERFTPEREKARHRYGWFPFGGGPRGCIGQHFSMLEAVLALAVLVRDFELTTPPGDIPVTSHITLRPVNSVPSRLTPRRGPTSH